MSLHCLFFCFAVWLEHRLGSDGNGQLAVNLTLNISSLTRSNGGEYKCQLGTKATSLKLKILGMTIAFSNNEILYMI